MSAAVQRSHGTLGIGLNERSKFTAEPKAKAKNFMPRPHNGVLELSSYALDDLEEPAVWTLFDLHLSKPALARAELTPDHVSVAQLHLDPNWEPERHVNIVGWPADEFDQKNVAQVLHDLQQCIRRDVAAA